VINSKNSLITHVIRKFIMKKLMFAAILSAGMLLFGAVATAFEIIPDAEALKARGTYLKDVATAKKGRTPSKVCGDELCTTIKDATIGLRKGQISRGFTR
jgi:hypothetical protein